MSIIKRLTYKVRNIKNKAFYINESCPLSKIRRYTYNNIFYICTIEYEVEV